MSTSFTVEMFLSLYKNDRQFYQRLIRFYQSFITIRYIIILVKGQTVFGQFQWLKHNCKECLIQHTMCFFKYYFHIFFFLKQPIDWKIGQPNGGSGQNCVEVDATLPSKNILI